MGFQKGNIPWNRGIPHSETSKEKMRMWRKDHAEEVRQNIIIALSNPEVRQKLSDNCAMKRPEIIAKCAASNRGKKRTPEFCAAMSKQRTGVPLPIEQRRKISEGVRK